MKVQTIDQYFILKEIKESFDMDAVTLHLTGKNEITVTDLKGKSISFIRDSKGVITLYGVVRSDKDEGTESK